MESVSGKRAEIDTSAPFESVKEAANLFGGMGFWKPIPQNPGLEPEHVCKRDGIFTGKEQHAAQLVRDLITREKETLDALKQLETAKLVVEELKLKLRKETSSDTNAVLKGNSPSNRNFPAEEAEEKENIELDMNVDRNEIDGSTKASGRNVLLELKQAELNLTQTRYDDALADIRATVDLYSEEIEKERTSLEKTRRKLSSNNLNIVMLQDELKRIELKDSEIQGKSLITWKLHNLSSETENFKNVGKSARSQLLRLLSDIDQAQCGIKTAEMRLIAAKKMKEAARASEAAALAELKVLSNKETEGVVTLTFEEYASLISSAHEAKEACKKRAVDAIRQVDEANKSTKNVTKKVEEVANEVKISKKALEEALHRVEAANRGKLTAEEALRKWRSEQGQKRRSVHSSIKFKNSHSSLHRKCSNMDDLNVASNVSKPVAEPSLSIGQILSRKLLLTEEYENGFQLDEKSTGKLKASSLGQMLSGKSNDDVCFTKNAARKGNGELPAKRRKFSLGRISLLVMKESKLKKKKGSSISMCHS